MSSDVLERDPPQSVFLSVVVISNQPSAARKYMWNTYIFDLGGGAGRFIRIRRILTIKMKIYARTVLESIYKYAFENVFIFLAGGPLFGG